MVLKQRIERYKTPSQQRPRTVVDRDETAKLGVNPLVATPPMGLAKTRIYAGE